jgi:hypothetical protein
MARIIYKLGEIVPRVFSRQGFNGRQVSVQPATGTITASSNDGNQHQVDQTTASQTEIKDWGQRQNRVPDMYEPGLKRSEITPTMRLGPTDDSNPSPMTNGSAFIGGNAMFDTSADMFGAGCDGGIMNADFQFSIINDFPFELTIGPPNLQGAAGEVGNMAGSREDFGSEFPGMADVEWLDEVIHGQGNDHR